MASDAVEVETIDIPRGTYWVRVYRRTHRERRKLYPGLVYAHGGK
jgi:dipeptidyl aminopeptidase/acylaminoacyl peptidase